MPSLDSGVVNSLLIRNKEALRRFTKAGLYEFFKSLFMQASDQGIITGTDPNVLFIALVNKIPLFPQGAIERCVKGILKFLGDEYEIFCLKTCMRRILTSNICLNASAINKACSESILLNDVHVREFLFDCIKSSGKDLGNAPHLFLSQRGRPFVEREKFFEFIFLRAIDKSLIDFVERYLYRIREGTVQNPYVDQPVDMPMTTGEDDTEIPDEDVKIGEAGEDQINPYNRVKELDAPLSQGGGSIHDRDYEEAHDRNSDRDTNGDLPHDDDHDRDHDRGRDGDRDRDRDNDRNRDRDRDRDHDRRSYDDEDDPDAVDSGFDQDTSTVSFNEDVDVQPFYRESVKSVLKPYKAPLVNSTRYDAKK
jgi:hypothetical protein